MSYPGQLSYPLTGTRSVVAAAGVAIADGVASPVLASPTSVEESGGSLRALLDPTDADGLDYGSGSGVVVVLDDQALTVGGSGVTLDRSWRTVDLSAPAAYHNQGAVITSVVSAGGGAYTFTRAAIASILDGPSDGMEAYRFPLLDSAGNTVDYASGRYLVEWEITLTSVTAGGSSLVMAGVKTQPTSYTAGVVRICGFSTDTAANDLSVCTALGSNGTTVKASLAKVTGTLVPTLIGSGSFDIGTLTAVSLDGSGARIGTPNDSTTASDATPGTCNEIAVWFGGDAVDASTRSFTIIFKYRVVQIRP